ncbi:MAG TPA: response regulator [Steroidobacteraceae bacterium]|nr:response regulator [Steroidobacteraceae bacterium]
MSNVSANAPLNVVIIDDNRDAADTLALLFEVIGHAAHVAYAARSGINLVQEVQPDLAFFDLNMPDLDGCEALAELKKSAPYLRTLFVCLTGQCSPEAKLRCQEAGFEHFITKPLSNVDFETIIDLAQRRRALG